MPTGSSVSRLGCQSAGWVYEGDRNMRCFSKFRRFVRSLSRLGLLVSGLVTTGWLSVLGSIPDETCATCHEKVAAEFKATAHGKYLSDRPALADKMCEACHADGAAHVEQSDPNLIINPGRMDQFGGKELCLSCHDDPQFDSWPFSHHNSAGVNCASCHQVHSRGYDSKVTAGPDMCYSCHTDVRAAAGMPSHHPIAEGRLTCQDCHNPHGGSVALTQGDSNRELCLSCHADVEGPFVYEHAPVTEDCMICHKPHGTVADNLLRATEPTLCLNCHDMHFHATIEGVDGAFSVPLAPERAGVSTPDAWKAGLLTKCTRCHASVHGSDLPSQATSDGGNGLTR
ncbi:MAG: GSU2203 family decaheme c-type cytochrome [Candidatus Zixiibacteriota bacterium]